jgi:hypothetical protein
MTPDTQDDSRAFGIWPTIVGLAIAVLIFTIMFSLATGFA